MNVGWFRRYRFLLLIYGFALFAGWLEYRDRRTSRPPDQPGEVLAELYPHSSEIQYILARGFEKQGAEQKLRGQNAESHASFEEARKHFENALATGVKTEEKLFYHYALTLVFLQADSTEIDRAITKWRYNFPDTKEIDPREPEAAKAALSDSAPRRGKY